MSHFDDYPTIHPREDRQARRYSMARCGTAATFSLDSKSNLICHRCHARRKQCELDSCCSCCLCLPRVQPGLRRSQFVPATFLIPRRELSPRIKPFLSRAGQLSRSVQTSISLEMPKSWTSPSLG